LNRSPSRAEFSEALLGVNSTFAGSMILFENVVQVLHRSVSITVAQRPFFLTVGDRGAVYRCQVGVDHSRLAMGWIAERLRNKRLAASASRNADSKKSMVAPLESMPRYK
jgi:hypothetical protein